MKYRDEDMYGKYRNSDKECACDMCERRNDCRYAGKKIRLPRDKGGRGLCFKIN